MKRILSINHNAWWYRIIRYCEKEMMNLLWLHGIEYNSKEVKVVYEILVCLYLGVGDVCE